MQPRRAKASEVARPMPEPPPVTRATFPFRLSYMALLLRNDGYLACLPVGWGGAQETALAIPPFVAP